MTSNDFVLRFLSHVDKGDSCWLWKASCDRNGYGHMWMDGKLVQSHRLAYKLFIGDIPDSVSVLHTCDNPSCCNPSHLFLGDQLANVQDMIRKGRMPSRRGEKNGHAKITSIQADEIRNKYKAGAKQKELSLEYGICQSAIAYITRGEHWK